MAKEEDKLGSQFDRLGCQDDPDFLFPVSSIRLEIRLLYNFRFLYICFLFVINYYIDGLFTIMIMH